MDATTLPAPVPLPVPPRLPLEEPGVTSDERSRIIAQFARHNPGVESVGRLERADGLHAYWVDHRLFRDTEAILQTLDLESVLLWYGFRLDRRKCSPGSLWRVYVSTSLGLSVTVFQPPEQPYKTFKLLKGSLQVATAKPPSAATEVGPPAPATRTIGGGNVLHLLRSLPGLTGTVWTLVDQLAADAEFWSIQESIETLLPTGDTPLGTTYTAFQARRREGQLWQDYGLSPTYDRAYLHSRGLSDSTLLRAFLWGRIAQSEYHYQPPGGRKPALLQSTAFLMTGAGGALLSINQRSARTNLYVKGSRGDALFRTNDRYTLRVDVDIDEKRSLMAGETIYLLFTDQKTFLASRRWRGELDGETGRKIRDACRADAPVAIIVGEAPIDLLSLYEMDGGRGEWLPTGHCLLVATGGRLSALGRTHLQTLLDTHAEAQLLLAGDNDEEGLRFMLLQLNLVLSSYREEYRVVVRVNFPAAESDELPLQQLTLRLFSPLSDVLQAGTDAGFIHSLHQALQNGAALFGESEAVTFSEEPYFVRETIGNRGEWTATLSFPARAVYLRECLYSTLNLLRTRHQTDQIRLIGFTGAGAHCKDFNEWLKLTQSTANDHDPITHSY